MSVTRLRMVFLVAVATLATATHAAAGAGDLDRSFGTDGVVYTPTLSGWGAAFKLLADEHGRIYAGAKGGPSTVIARYLPEGTLDTTFGSNGLVVDDRVIDYGLAYFTRGRSGDLYAVNTVGDGDTSVVTHYDADGHVDDAFGVGGLASIPLRDLFALETAPDGSVFAAGRCCGTFHFSCMLGLAHVFPDGTVDPVYTPPGDFCRSYPANGTFQAIRFEGDQVVAAGFTGNGNWAAPDHRIVVARFRADGSGDPSFGTGGVAIGPQMTAILMHFQADGRIVTIDEGDGGLVGMARFLPNATLDPSFGNGGRLAIQQPWDYGFTQAVDVQADGKILVGGEALTADDPFRRWAIMRLMPDGSLDDGFGDGGYVHTPIRPFNGESFEEVVFSFLERPGGLLIAGGSSIENEFAGGFALARYLATPCGDGVLAASEACDEGPANGSAASCCAVGCTLRPDGAVCTSADRCVVDTHCTAGACVGEPVVCPICTSCAADVGCTFTPRADCHAIDAAGHADLALRRRSSGDRLALRWSGSAIPVADLGDPITRTTYALCIAETQASTLPLVLAARVPAGGTCGGNRSCWRQTASRTIYRGSSGAPDGITKVTLDPAHGRLQVVGSGTHLAMPALPLSAPLAAEIRADDGGCWQLSITPDDVRHADAARFDAAVP